MAPTAEPRAPVAAAPCAPRAAGWTGSAAPRPPRTGHQPRRHPDHSLTASDQEPLTRARDLPAVLQRPHPIAAETAHPLQHPGKAADADADRLVAEHLARPRGDPDDRVRALVHVRTEHDHQLSPLLLAVEVDGRRTRLARGRGHAPFKSRRTSRPATSDTTKGSQARPADSLKESQLAAGRDLLLSAGHHRRGITTASLEAARGLPGASPLALRAECDSSVRLGAPREGS